MKNKIKKIIQIKQMKKKSLLLTFALFGIMPTFSNETEESDIQYEENIIVIEDSTTHNFNPHLTDLASDVQILSSVYEGLFSYNPSTLEPMYAIAINYNISRDKKRWTFDINPQAKFSNGEAITAEHVKSSWLTLLATPNAPYASLLDVIEGAASYRNGEGSEEDVGIYVLSELKLMVHLEKPASYLPKVLCHPSFAIVHEKQNVFSGPYVIEKEAVVTETCESESAKNNNQKTILKKNEYYWDAKNVLTKQFTFIQSDNPDENAHLYNNGDADWINASVSTQKIIDKKDCLIFPQYGTSYMFFKLKEGESENIWSHIEFRQALFEAFPWEQFRFGYYVPATTFVYPLAGYPTVDGFDFTDLMEAQKIMENARKKYNIPSWVKIPLNIDISKGSFTSQQLLLLKSTCDSLGIDLKVKEYPVYKYFDIIPTSTADIFQLVWIGDFADPYAFLELFRSDSTLNSANFKNADFDSLLDKATSASATESLNYYAQAETLLLDNYIVFPLHHPVGVNVINTSVVSGWVLNAMDLHPLKYIYKKKQKYQFGKNVI